MSDQPLRVKPILDTQAPPGLPAVQTHELGRTYGSMAALSGLNLTVNRGDLFGFIGSNGAGKTTTLRILATFLTPSSGSAEVLGYNVVRNADAVRHLIGYMPDFFGACYKIPSVQREKTVSDVLELVGLSEKKGSLIGALSRGMQQRLGLARVLIHDPQLLLLDEPASGLDPRARIEMMEILQELQRMGKTIIISSHILSELQSLCNRCAIIERGKLIYCGPVSGISGGSEHSKVWVRATPIQRAAELLLARPEVTGVEIVDDRIEIALVDPQANLAFVAETLVQNSCRLTELRREEIGLEEVFMRVTRGDTQ